MDLTARPPAENTMSHFNDELSAELQRLADDALRRELRRIDSPQATRIEVGGRALLNFSSNDYLGLANHPAVKEAAIDAIARFGGGSGASRLISGSLAPHHQLEERLAVFKGTEAALSFSSGYAAALGTIPALVGKPDVVVIDKLMHASIVDAVRLSGARLRVFAHNDLTALEDILKWADRTPGATAQTPGRRPRILIITESVFSMDGDLAPLRDIVELKDRHGAWLMVDEAHATGLFGSHRRGVAEAFAISDRVEIQMGTLGKAVGAAGGYICGSRPLIDLLVNKARSFIFSTAPVPAQSAAARAGIEIIQSAEGHERCGRVWLLVDRLKNGLIALGRPAPLVQSAIVPLIIGAEQETLRAAACLRENDIFVPAVRFPTVARGQARLRITMTAAHTEADVGQIMAALEFLRSDSR